MQCNDTYLELDDEGLLGVVIDEVLGFVVVLGQHSVSEQSSTHPDSLEQKPFPSAQTYSGFPLASLQKQKIFEQHSSDTKTSSSPTQR